MIVIDQLATDDRTCYAFDGRLYVLDGDAQASDGFHLLHEVTSQLLGANSDSRTATPEEQVGFSRRD